MSLNPLSPVHYCIQYTVSAVQHNTAITIAACHKHCIRLGLDSYQYRGQYGSGTNVASVSFVRRPARRRLVPFKVLFKVLYQVPFKVPGATCRATSRSNNEQVVISFD